MEQIKTMIEMNESLAKQVEDQEDILRNLFAEVERVDDSIEETKDSYQKIEGKRRQLAEKIEECEVKIVKINQNNMEGRNDVKMLQEKQQSLKGQIRDKMKFKEIQKKEQVRISNNLMNMEREQQNVEKILENLEDQVKEQDEKIHSKTENINNLKDKLKKVKNNNQILTKMYNQKIKEKKTIQLSRDVLSIEKQSTKKHLILEEERLDNIRENQKKEEKQLSKLEEMLRRKRDGLLDASDKLLELERITKKLNNQVNGVHGEIKRLGVECEKVKMQQEKYAEVASVGHTRFYEKIEELKLKNFMVGDLQRVNVELANRLKEEQIAYEGVRTERNTHGKRLLEMKEEILECANRHKGLVHEIKQLSEEVSLKNIFSIRQTEKSEFIKNQNIELEGKLLSLENKIKTFEESIKYNEIEIDKLKVLLVEAEEEKKKKLKEQNLIMNERDILGRQIIKRKQDMNKILKDIKVLQYYIKNSENQFINERNEVEDLEMQLEETKENVKLNHLENEGFITIQEEVEKLNKECWVLKNRNALLKEEIGYVLNVHEWRELKVTQPKKYDLILKLQGLQKKNISEENKLKKLDRDIKDKKNEFKDLKENINRGIGKEGQEKLYKLQEALSQKKQNFSEVLLTMKYAKKKMDSLKVDILKLDTSLDMYKKNYFAYRNGEDICDGDGNRLDLD
jgi:chromosome segregation ATPase